MRKCPPNKRTPFCGAPGCEWPEATRQPFPAELAIDAAIKIVECTHSECAPAVVLDLERARTRLATYYDTGMPAPGLTFGEALDALKQGRRVARSGWNGKGMYLALTHGSKIPADAARSGAVKAVADTEDVKEITILSHIDMRAADGSVVVGWLASQPDMLSNDWQVLP